VVVSNMVVFVPVNGGSGYGIKIGPMCKRVSLRDVRVESYVNDANHVPINTVLIEAGATGTVLDHVTTDPNGGGDIADNAADTAWVNVNGITRLPGGLAPGAVVTLPEPIRGRHRGEPADTGAEER